MFGFGKSKKVDSTEVLDFDAGKFKESLLKTGISLDKAEEITADLSTAVNDRVTEKAEMSYDNFMSAVSSNVEGLSVLPTERIAACKELTTFLSENPEVNNSIRLYASYIAYGSAETKLEEYKVTILGKDAEAVKKADRYVKKWEKRSKIRRVVYPLAKDLIPFGDAFLEKLYVHEKDRKTLVGVAHIPAHTMYPKLNSKGYATKYYQIIGKGESFADADHSLISSMVTDGTVIQFDRDEIAHFSDGSTVGVTDTPYYNLIILWRYLKMLEESLVIHRMTRARRFIIFFLDVTGKTKIEVRSAVSNFTQRIKSVFKLDVKGGSVSSTRSTVPSSSDLVIPVTKDSKTKIQNIPSDVSASKTDDLEFYLNRLTTNMFTSHVFKNSQQTGNEKYIEKSFMRLVKIYQKQMEYTLEDIYAEILESVGITDLEIKIQFPSPDSEQEIRIVDSIVRRMMIINQLTATIGATPPTKWIVNYVFKDLAQYEIEELINMLEYVIKEQEESEQGGEFTSIFDEQGNKSSASSTQQPGVADEEMRDQGAEGATFESANMERLFNTTKLERVVESTSTINDRLAESIKLSLTYLAHHNRTKVDPSD